MHKCSRYDMWPQCCLCWSWETQVIKTVPPVPDDSGDDDGGDPDQLYCFCRQPDMETFMIMYVVCHVLFWIFHPQCDTSAHMHTFLFAFVLTRLYSLCGGKSPTRCEECDEWFHGECVHMTEEEADLVASWTCHGCRGVPFPKVTLKRKPQPQPQKSSKPSVVASAKRQRQVKYVA